jgi:sugar phosphate isomerase/epimerase
MPKIPRFASKMIRIAQEAEAAAVILVAIGDGNITLTSTGMLTAAELDTMAELLQEVVETAKAYHAATVEQA